MSLADDRTDVFIVRIWHEPQTGGTGSGIWRGNVEHLETGSVRHFQDMATLVAFVAGQAGISDDGS